MKDNIIKWISEWYENNCDGEWEQNYGITIDTLDNPGWSISIDLIDLDIEFSSIPWTFIEKSQNDWYGYKIENGKFEASGDPTKLTFLLNKFKEIVEDNFDEI